MSEKSTKTVSDIDGTDDVWLFNYGISAGYSNHLPPDRSPQFLRFLAAEMGHKLKFDFPVYSSDGQPSTITRADEVSQVWRFWGVVQMIRRPVTTEQKNNS